MALLTNREWDVEGTWYAPQEFLTEKFSSVVRSQLWNTSNSAGDWDGYFVQKHGRRFYLINFWQENLAWTPCFRLATADRPFASCGHEPTKQECDDLRQAWEQMCMQANGEA